MFNKALRKNKIYTPINPWWFIGFIDGEGCFSIGIYRNKNKVGWQVKLEFWISLHEKDKALLERIQNYLKVGNIHRHPSQKLLHYRIQSTKELKIIIDHLDLYPLISSATEKN